ncbi:MAG: restriction endonuclease [Christensenellaceae bacterium]
MRDNKKLIELLLSQELFPLKDSYVSYLRKDRSAIERNPKTIDRLAGAIYSLGIDDTINRMSSPKETNRQIGPLFRRWIKNKSLGIETTEDEEYFLSTTKNMILDKSDQGLANFAKSILGYSNNKGLDLVLKYEGKDIVGEAKFLTDFGGHQNAQLLDALTTIKSEFKTSYEVLPIAILDGVIYIENGGKMYKTLEEVNEEKVILSSLLLRDFIFSL